MKKAPKFKIGDLVCKLFDEEKFIQRSIQDLIHRSIYFKFNCYKIFGIHKYGSQEQCNYRYLFYDENGKIQQCSEYKLILAEEFKGSVLKVLDSCFKQLAEEVENWDLEKNTCFLEVLGNGETSEVPGE